MRIFGSTAVHICIAAIALITTVIRPTSGHAQTPEPTQAQRDQAQRVLADARQAMGGEARIAAVKTLVANGRTRQVRGDNLVPIEFEIQAEFPDKYSRRDEIPAQDTGPTTTGFNGDRLVQLPAQPAPVGRPGGPPPPTPEQLEAAARARAVTAKQDFSRLMLGLFATSYSSFPLAFAYAGQAEAPQGKADMLDVTGPANFAARLFIDSQTHLPIMVSWQVRTPPRGGGPGARPGGPGPGAAPPAAPPGAGSPAAPPSAGAGAVSAAPPAAGAAAAPGAPGAAPRAGGPPPQAPAVENRLYFADYREVDGLRLPFRVRRAVAADTVEETTFDRFRINARIDPRRFDVGN